MAGSFEIDIAKFVAKANGNVNLVIRKISLDIFSRVILKSPVDTGRFRGNWQVGIGSMPSGTLSVNDKDGSMAMGKVTAALLGQGGQFSARAGDVIYLVNNLAYAQALEYGHSKQAPNGMVRLTLTEFPQVVNKAAGEVRQ